MPTRGLARSVSSVIHEVRLPYGKTRRRVFRCRGNADRTATTPAVATQREKWMCSPRVRGDYLPCAARQPSGDRVHLHLEELEETAAKSKRFRGSNSSKDHQKENSKPKSDQKTIVAASLPKEKLNAEPPKDYIHVRARRGQATDSHSLAERARREKISERMKVLQDLVPGCSKVTGKAVMLDEIINYVQSLQSQVEFLSMKLAVVNRDIGIEIDNFLPREQLHPLPLQGSDDPMLFCTNGGNYNAPPQLPAEHQALLLDVALPASNGAYPLIDRTCSTLPDGIAVGLSQVSSSWGMELQKFEEF